MKQLKSSVGNLLRMFALTIYESHTEMNSLLKFDRHQELGLIEAFAGALDRAFAGYQDHLFGSPLIPEWRRIEVALDGVLPELTGAFESTTPPPVFQAPEAARKSTLPTLFPPKN